MAVSTDLIKSSAELGAGVATLAFAVSAGAPLLSGLTATGVALAGIGAALLGQKTVQFGPALKQRIASQLKSAGADLPEGADWVIALKLNLPKLTLTQEAAAQLSTQDGGYTANATQALLERLAQSNSIFHDPAQDSRGEADARNAAEMIIRAGVQAAYTDRAAFEALEPALLEQALSKLGDIDRKADRIEEGIEELPDRTVKVLLAELKRQGVLSAEGDRGVVSRDTVETLARRFNDFEGDLDQQVRELIRRLDAAESLIEEGQHPGNVDAFIREVQRRVSDLTRSNDLDAAEQAFEDGLAEFRRQKAERDEADIRNELALLHTGILMASASGDVRSVLRYELQRLELDAKRAEPDLSLYEIWKTYYDRAERQRAQLDMQVCVGLAEHGIDQPPSSEQAVIWQHSLGISKSLLGQARGEQTLLEDAITAYNAALQVCTQDRAPMAWAMTQNNLGTVLQALGEQRGDEALLQDAVTAYKAALQEHTQVRTPMAWAMTQSNLGSVLQALGEQRGNEALLEDAIIAYNAALQERRQDQVPMAWANTQNNLGNVLTVLGEQRGDEALLENAIAAYNAALKEHTKARAPMDWAMTQSNLGTVLQTLGQQRDDEALLEHAMTAYKAALQVYTQDRAPMNWATTQNNLGSVRKTLGQKRGDEALLEDAMTAYKAALQVYTQDRAPMDWAMTWGNLGVALCLRGIFKREAETIEHGITTIEDALAVFNEAGAKGYAGVFNRTLKTMRAALMAVRSIDAPMS